MIRQVGLVLPCMLLLHLAAASPLWCGLPNPLKGKGKVKESAPIEQNDGEEIIWPPAAENIERLGADTLHVDYYHFSGELPMQPNNDANFKPYYSALKEKKSDYEGERLQNPPLKGSRRSKNSSSNSSQARERGKGKKTSTR